MDHETDLEKISFGIIAYAGDAKSCAFGALQAAKNGDFDKAAELLRASDAAAAKAHQIQTELLCQEANGSGAAVDVLLVHAQDHLMTSLLAVDLIKELIELYKR